LYVYNYSAYAKIEWRSITVNNLREEADGDQAINWLEEIPREKWTLTWDGSLRWGHMTIDLAESTNLELKKTRNLPINVLVKSTYKRCNTLFNQRKREVATD